MKTHARLIRCLQVLPLVVLVAAISTPALFAQETTAGIQGLVKDPTGAVVPKATVEVTGPALIGSKAVETDSGGFYRISSLPPGSYDLTVNAGGFRKYKLSGIRLEVGRLPNVDVVLAMGSATEVVEVTGQSPIVDVTQSKVAVTVDHDQIDNMPKGRSFQSLIPFAPGARQEPLQGSRNNRTNGFKSTEPVTERMST